MLEISALTSTDGRSLTSAGRINNSSTVLWVGGCSVGPVIRQHPKCRSHEASIGGASCEPFPSKGCSFLCGLFMLYLYCWSLLDMCTICFNPFSKMIRRMHYGRRRGILKPLIIHKSKTSISQNKYEMWKIIYMSGCATDEHHTDISVTSDMSMTCA